MMSITQSETKCLNAFFEYFDEQNIAYCVVGDCRALPELVPSDIDIVIGYADFVAIAEKVYRFAQQNKCCLVQLLQHESTAAYFAISFAGNNQIEYIHPDICSDYYRNGIPFVSAAEILKGRQPALYPDGSPKRFFVACADAEFIYYLIKKIDKGAMDHEQFNHLQQQYQQEPQKCQAAALKYWPIRDVEKIIGCMQSADFEALQGMMANLKRLLAANTKISINDRWQEFKRKVSRVCHPTGLQLVFLGPDGAGKTAIGDRLETELAAAFRGLKRFHLRPSVFNSNTNSGSPVTDPHGKAARGSLPSVAKLCYFLADYLVGYFLRVLPLKIRSHLVIFDRYYHDLLIDPRRYRYGGPMWMARLIGRFIPQPDLFIVLDAPAEIIQSRKQEVTLEETQRQRQAYLAFASSQPNCIVLDTSVGIDETVQQGTQAVLDFMQQRLAQRLQLK